MFLWASAIFSGEVRHRTFSEQEVKKMEHVKAIIHTGLGDVHLRFFPDVAPNHVNNFVTLAREKFFDGSIFHRVIPGFVIQGGDPNSKNADRSMHGTGGPGYTVKAEFNNRPHKRGILSMARSAHPDSAGSQFFICVADVPSLDGKYTVFGEVTQGMEVVDKIVSLPRDRRDNPLERVEMRVEVLGLEKPGPGNPPSSKGQ
jgi:peptidyl-prolyl cis-trans isomerase B (cyclophilin B)